MSTPPGDLFVFTRGEGDSQRSYSYPQHEAKALAAQLGMDLHSDADLLWFLKEALVTILPQGWKKEANASGMAQYHNLKTGVTTETHPLLYIFRAAYHHLVETNEQQKAEAGPIDDPSSLQSSTEQSRFFADLLKKIEKKQDSVKSTLRFEQAMHDAELFYSSLLTGSSVPKHLEDSLEFQSVAPERMMELARALGVQDDYRLLWVARVFAVLPLPPLWKRSHDPYRNDLYLNSHYNVTLGFHPSKNFLYKYIQTLRFGNLEASSATMTFLDRHYRSYDIDLHRLMAGEDYVLRVRDFPGQRNLPVTLFRPKIAYSQETIDGLMALDMADGDIEMLGLVYRYYAKMKKKMKGWEFRYTLQGERYWYQSGSQAAKRQYPFSEKLKKLLQQARSMHTRMLAAVLKSPEEVHKTLPSKDLLAKMRKAAAELMGRHLSNYMESHNQEALEAHDAAKWLSFKPDSPSELIEILYTCPFRLSALTLDTTSSIQFTSTETEEDGVLSPKDHYTVEVEGQSLLPSLESGAQIRSLKSLLARPRAARQSRVLEKELLERLTGRQSSGMRLMVRKEEVADTVAGKALEEVKSLREEQIVGTAEDRKLTPQVQTGTNEPYNAETKAAMEQKRRNVEATGQAKSPHPSESKPGAKHADRPSEAEVVSSVIPLKPTKIKPAFSKSLSFKAAFRQPVSPHGSPAPSSFPNTPLSFDPSSLAKAAISGMMSRVKKSQSFTRNEGRKRSRKEQLEEGESSAAAEPRDVVKEAEDEERDSESGSSSPAVSNLVSGKSLLTAFLRNTLSFLSQPSVPSAQQEPASIQLSSVKGRGKTGNRLFSLDGRELPASPQFSSPAGSTVASPAHSRQTSTVLSSKSALTSPKVSPSSSTSRRVFTLSASQRTLVALKRRRLGSAGEGSPRMRGGSFGGQLEERKEGGARKRAVSRPVGSHTAAKIRPTEGSFAPTSPLSPQLSSSFLAYYFKACGSPFDLFDLRLYRPYLGLSVPDIVSTGLRLGIKVSLEVLESLESDLLWVAYLQLLVPEPPEWEKTGVERLALGKHPGDEYFSLMLGYHRDRRNRLLKAMSRADRVSSLLENSWLEVQPQAGVCFLHNFLTHEDGPSSTLALVKFSFQPSRAAVTAPGRVRRR